MSDKELGFDGLVFYKLGLKLLKAVYKLNDELPAHEKYNFADQMRRSALSTLLNIAEGYGRYHYLDKLRFFYFARGSLNETFSGFIAANAVGYIDDARLEWVREIKTEAEKSLNGYINFIRQQKQGAAEYGNRQVQDTQSEYHVEVDFDDELLS